MKEGLRPEKLRLQGNYPKGGPRVEYVGIDWGYERAAWFGRSLDDLTVERAAAPGRPLDGEIVGEGLVPADADGLLQLVGRFGGEVKACVEMMSGAVWVRDRLADCGWQVE